MLNALSVATGQCSLPNERMIDRDQPPVAPLAPPPVNSPVPQAPPVVTVAGINRIYLEQEKLPKRPGTIRGFIRGRVVLP